VALQNGGVVLDVISYPVVETPIGLQLFLQLLDISVSGIRRLGSVGTGSLALNIFWYSVAETPIGLQLGT
jgi:hypothetical protein